MRERHHVSRIQQVHTKRDRQTDTQTHKHPDRHTDTQTDRETLACKEWKKGEMEAEYVLARMEC